MAKTKEGMQRCNISELGYWCQSGKLGRGPSKKLVLVIASWLKGGGRTVQVHDDFFFCSLTRVQERDTHTEEDKMCASCMLCMLVQDTHKYILLLYRIAVSH